MKLLLCVGVSGSFSVAMPPPGRLKNRRLLHRQTSVEAAYVLGAHCGAYVGSVSSFALFSAL